MKKTKIIKSILFVALLLCVFISISAVMQDKNNVEKYKEFYKEKENFDVLFFGSSRMLDGVYPTELWNTYQITSYNMAQHAESLPVTYWQIKNALNYTTPKVIVVDVSVFWGGQIQLEDTDQLNYLHKSIDHMRLSKTKIQAVASILAEGTNKEEYIIPVMLYHTRWNALVKNDFEPTVLYEKGAEYQTGYTFYDTPLWSSDEFNEAFDMQSTRLADIVSLCAEENIELVFTYMPCYLGTANPDLCADINQVEKWAAEQGIPFLNMCKVEGLVNYESDFLDLAHTNASGARKVTNYLGAYLCANYTFQASNNQKTTDSWTECSTQYFQMKCDQIVLAEEITSYLMLLNDPGFSYVISVNNGNDLLKNESVLGLLRELGAEISVAESQAGPDITIIKDGKKGKAYSYINEKYIEKEISIGTVKIEYMDLENQKESDIFGIQSTPILNDHQIDIYVFNAKTGEEIDNKQF